MLALGMIQDWKTAYIIADEKPTKELAKLTYLDSSVSRWKNSAKIKKALEEAIKYFADRDADERKKGFLEGQKAALQGTEQEKEDNIRIEPGKPLRIEKYIDYSDPAAQTRKLNELVNTADDPGEALDALKVIIQTQKADRDAAREGKQVRAYLPISCTGCPLYKLQVKKRERKSDNLQ